MKIVVEWWHGSEFSGEDYLECVEAESCEWLYCKLEEEYLRYRDACNAYRQRYDDLYERHRQAMASKNPKADGIFTERLCMNRPSPDIAICNATFNLDHFWSRARGNESQFDPPNIYELDEWFTKKLNGQI